jgi:valyl-tRNA synthetase
MGFLLDLKTEVLSLRKELGVEEKAAAPIYLWCEQGFFRSVIDECTDLFRRLAKVSDIEYFRNPEGIPSRLTKRIGNSFEVAVVYERTVDVAAERERLTKDIAKFEKGLAAAERQLGNEGFVAKAPAHIVDGLKRQEAETRGLLNKARAALESLPKEA